MCTPGKLLPGLGGAFSAEGCPAFGSDPGGAVVGAAVMELARQAEQLQELAGYYKTDFDATKAAKFRKEREKLVKPVTKQVQASVKSFSPANKVVIQMPQEDNYDNKYERF